MISQADVVLETQCGARFTVVRAHAEQMKTVMSQLEQSTSFDAVCLLPEIEEPILEAVLDFLASNDQASFFDALSVKMPFQLLKAANYLECQSLMNAAASHIARVCVNKTGAQIQAYYGLQPAYTPEEEKRIYADVADMDYSDTN